MAPEQDGFNIDPALLQDFLVESRESLEGLGELFVILESHPEDHGIIDRIFRPVHSIKGNSSFFGLSNIKNFSHSLENLLQELRSRELRVTPAVIDVLLRGVDMLTAMVDRLAAGETSVDLLPEEEALLGEVSRVREGGAQDAAQMLLNAVEAARRLKAGVPEEFSGDLKLVSAALDNLLAELAPNALSSAGGEGGVRYTAGGADVTDRVNAIHNFLHDLQARSRDTEACEAFLAHVLHLEELAREAGEKHLFESLEEMRDDFETIHNSGIEFDELLSSLLHEKFDTVLEALGRSGPAGEDEPPADPALAGMDAPAEEEAAQADSSAPPPASAAAAEEVQVSKTIRIAEEKVDGFMAFVGELIITSEVFAYIQKKLEGVQEVRDVALEFKKAVLSFNELSMNLQKSLMEVRRVPVKTVLQKLPRTVRDLARELGKEVELVMEGQTVSIDKSLIEALEAPITHMVRNAVDHGIEDPQARREAGKPPAGTVRIEAECDEETFTLKIIDDGRGLDVDALKAKAVEAGRITPAQADSMSDKEAYRLIFGAGISTAKAVTEVSGRGVGMDVVISNIQNNNGTVEIDSEKGKGSTVTITLPMTVTLLVVDGLLAQVADTTYIIPLSDVVESFKPAQEDISSVGGRGEVVNVRGKLHPLVRLHRLFGVKPRFENPWESVVVIVRTENEACALFVDELIGQQSVVLKEMEDYFEKLKILRGGAILGSGRVGLVLDIEELIAATVIDRR